MAISNRQKLDVANRITSNQKNRMKSMQSNPGFKGSAKQLEMFERQFKAVNKAKKLATQSTYDLYKVKGR